MKSYIKIYGPPVYDAIKVLEKLAIDFPEACIMDTLIERLNFPVDEFDRGQAYIQSVGDVSPVRCSKMISRSGERVGEYDFYFEWFTPPTVDQLNDLIRKIDKALLG